MSCRRLVPIVALIMAVSACEYTVRESKPDTAANTRASMDIMESSRIIAQWGSRSALTLPSVKPPISRPDVELEFHASVIKKIITDFIGVGWRIPLRNSKLDSLNNSYIVVNSVQELSTSEHGVIFAKIRGYAVLDGLLPRESIQVNDMSLQIVPDVLVKGRRILIQPYILVSFLDLDGVTAPLDKALANLVNELLQQDKVSQGLLFDVTKLLKPAIGHPFRKGSVKLLLNRLSVVVQRDRVLVQAKR